MIADILKAARARITPETWGQGADVTFDDKFCAGLALNACVTYSLATVNQAYDLLSCVATGSAAGDRRALPRWNDAPGRTCAQVLDAFDAAIAIAEQQEAAAAGARVVERAEVF